MSTRPRTSNGVDLSIVVPVYNNGGTLAELIDRLIAVVDSLGVEAELIFVDDGSADHGLELLEQRALAEPRLRVLALSRNFGGQAALCAGFDAVRGRRVVCIDADLENVPEDIPALLDALDRGSELACGVRESRGDLSPVRRLASSLLNSYARRKTDKVVHDVACGLRAMDSRVVANLARDGDQRRLLTPLLLRRAASVVEVPVRHRPSPRAGGHSLPSLAGMAADYYLVTAKRPFLITGCVSAFAFAAGIALLATAGLRSDSTLAMAGAVVTIGGALGAAISLLGEFVQRVYQLEQRQPYYELREDERPAGRDRGSADDEGVVRERRRSG